MNNNMTLPPRWQEVRLRRLAPSNTWETSATSKTIILVLINGQDGRVRTEDVIDFGQHLN